MPQKAPDQILGCINAFPNYIVHILLRLFEFTPMESRKYFIFLSSDIIDAEYFYKIPRRVWIPLFATLEQFQAEELRKDAWIHWKQYKIWKSSYFFLLNIQQ